MAKEQTSPLNVRRIGGVTMAENHSPTRPPITGKPHRCQADEDLVARFICHVNSTHVLQSLWRGLLKNWLQTNCGKPSNRFYPPNHQSLSGTLYNLPWPLRFSHVSGSSAPAASLA